MLEISLLEILNIFEKDDLPKLKNKMFQFYKDSLSNQNITILITELLSEKDYDEQELNDHFHKCFFFLYHLDKNSMYNEEIPVYEEISKILSWYADLDFTDIHHLNLFSIFYNFICFEGPDNFDKSTEIIIRIIILMFIKCGQNFAEGFSSSLLCRLFIEHINMNVLNLFSLIIGTSNKINKDLTDIGLITKLIDLNTIPNVDTQIFRKTKFLIYSNYALKCDMSDFVDCQKIVDECYNEMQNENDEECYCYQITCILRAVKRSISIMKNLVQKKVISYITLILSSDNKERIRQCLLLLEILTSNANEIDEQLSSELSLSHLLQQLLNFDENGLKAINCVINLMNYDIFSIEQYISNQFPQILNNIFANGPYEMKEAAIECINNMIYLLSFKRNDKYRFSSVFSDEIISNIILSITDFSFDENIIKKEDFINECLIILKTALTEDKFYNIDEVCSFLDNLYHEVNNEQIALKCKDILMSIEEKINKARNE